MRSSGIYDSDTASVYSTASHTSHFDTMSVSSSASGIKRRTKKMKKRVTNLFRKNKNGASTRISTEAPQLVVERKEMLTVALPIQELRSSRPITQSSAAHRKNLDRQTAGVLALRRSDAGEISEGREDYEANWTEAFFDQVSTSEQTLKVENPIKYRTPPTRTTRPFCTNFEGCILVIIMLVLFNLSCEIRFKGALLNPGALRNLVRDLTQGRMSILAIIARELATLAVSSLMTMTGIIALICSLDESMQVQYHGDIVEHDGFPVGFSTNTDEECKDKKEQQENAIERHMSPQEQSIQLTKQYAGAFEAAF